MCGQVVCEVVSSCVRKLGGDKLGVSKLCVDKFWKWFDAATPCFVKLSWNWPWGGGHKWFVSCHRQTPAAQPGQSHPPGIRITRTTSKIPYKYGSYSQLSAATLINMVITYQKFALSESKHHQNTSHPISYIPIKLDAVSDTTNVRFAWFCVPLWLCPLCDLQHCRVYFDSLWFSIIPSSHVLPTEHAPLKCKEIMWRPTNPLLQGMAFFGSY